MALSKERIVSLELPINRTSHHLRRGVAEDLITPALIGHDVDPDEIPDIIAVSKERTARAQAAYREMTRKFALWCMAGGAILLLLLWFASARGSEIPRLRTGRAILGLLLGGGLMLYGAWRWIDPSYKG